MRCSTKLFPKTAISQEIVFSSSYSSQLLHVFFFVFFWGFVRAASSSRFLVWLQLNGNWLVMESREILRPAFYWRLARWMDSTVEICTIQMPCMVFWVIILFHVFLWYICFLAILFLSVFMLMTDICFWSLGPRSLEFSGISLFFQLISAIEAS